MQEFMINYRGYAFIWADDNDEAEKLFKKRFRRSGINGVSGELEHIEVSQYQDNEKERLWK